MKHRSKGQTLHEEAPSRCCACDSKSKWWREIKNAIMVHLNKEMVPKQTFEKVKFNGMIEKHWIWGLTEAKIFKTNWAEANCRGSYSQSPPFLWQQTYGYQSYVLIHDIRMCLAHRSVQINFCFKMKGHHSRISPCTSTNLFVWKNVNAHTVKPIFICLLVILSTTSQLWWPIDMLMQVKCNPIDDLAWQQPFCSPSLCVSIFSIPPTTRHTGDL